MSEAHKGPQFGHVVSDAEFAAPGGGSRRLLDKRKGPDEGYYVSTSPKNGGVEEHVSASASGLANVMGAHHERAKATLGRVDHTLHEEMYQGKWVPGAGEGDTAVLDVSRRFQPNQRTKALAHGIKEKQVGVWDAKNADTLQIMHDDGNGVSTGKLTRLGAQTMSTVNRVRNPQRPNRPKRA